MKQYFYLFCIFLFLFIAVYVYFPENSEAKDVPVIVTLSFDRNILKIIARDSLGQDRKTVEKKFLESNTHISSFSYIHLDTSVIITITTSGYQFLKDTLKSKKDLKITISCSKFTLYRMSMPGHDLEDRDISDFSVSGKPVEFKIMTDEDTYNFYFTYNLYKPETKKKKPQVKKALPKLKKKPAPVHSNTIYAVKSKYIPIIDGKEQDKIWKKIPFTSLSLSGRLHIEAIQIKAVYTDDKIAFLFKWKDKSNNYSHRVWKWDKTKKRYLEGPDREDRLVIKFALNKIFSSCPKEGKKSTADIWDWRASLTNPSGHADDKSEIISLNRLPRSYRTKSGNNKPIWLQYLPDKGKSPFRQDIATTFNGNSISQFLSQTPTESRADVSASGLWDKGFWTVELVRSIKTSDKSDVEFDPKKDLSFAVAVYDHSELRNHNYSKTAILKFK